MSSTMRIPSFLQIWRLGIIGSHRLIWRLQRCLSVTGVSLLASVILIGCSSVRLGYSNGTTLSYWWLDRYVDFNREQAPKVRAAMDQWFVWHRSQRLAQDLALLERAQREVRSDLTPAQICAWWSVGLQWTDRALLQLVPAVAEIGPTLTPPQLAHLEDHFNRKNRDWSREHLQPDRQDRLDAELGRVSDNAEKLYGRLDRSQAHWLETELAHSVWDPALALAQHKAHQQDTLQLLRQLVGQPGVAAEPLVRDWLTRQLAPTDATAQRSHAAFVTERCQLSAELHNRTTPEQRRHAVETLAGWQQDLRGFLAPGAQHSAAAGAETDLGATLPLISAASSALLPAAP
jgi:hypothetical protein